MADFDDIELMSDTELEVLISDLQDEINSDSCLRGTSDFHHVEDRLKENEELMEKAIEQLGYTPAFLEDE